ADDMGTIVGEVHAVQVSGEPEELLLVPGRRPHNFVPNHRTQNSTRGSIPARARAPGVSTAFRDFRPADFVLNGRTMPTTSWTFPRADLLPTYAFVVSDTVKAEVRATGADIIDLGLGNPDRPTPPAIVEQLQQASQVGQNHRYHPGRGLIDL